jgi:hypothetical protein
MKIIDIKSTVALEDETIITRTETESGTIIWRYGQDKNYDLISPADFKRFEAEYQDQLTQRHLKLLDQVLPKITIGVDLARPNSDVSMFSVEINGEMKHIVSNPEMIQGLKEVLYSEDQIKVSSGDEVIGTSVYNGYDVQGILKCKGKTTAVVIVNGEEINCYPDSIKKL